MTGDPVRCRACGRPLRDDASRARHLGPVCLRRLRPEPTTTVAPLAVPARLRGRGVEDVPLFEIDDEN